jgi:hypothetical protein
MLTQRSYVSYVVRLVRRSPFIFNTRIGKKTAIISTKKGIKSTGVNICPDHPDLHEFYKEIT